MPLSPPQQEIVAAPQRFKCVIAGRRFGKTHLSIRQLCFNARMPERTVWYVAPTYRQAKMITWKKLKQRLMDLRWVSKINETELTLELKNNSTISLKGADNHDSLRGIGLDYLVIDEFADVDPDAWYETLRPTLSDREGHALFIGTPKGLNWAHDLYNLQQEFPNEWASFQYTTLEGGNVSEKEIEAARSTLDVRTFRQEYEATFETFSGRVFYAFDRQTHIRNFKEELPYEIVFGCDFNVDNLVAAIAVKTKTGLHFIDEIHLSGSNTDELVQEIRTRYPNHSLVAYPDPSGASRKTASGGRTDHTIIRAANIRVVSPHGHNSVRDGINAVNSLLRSSSGQVNLFIDPRCKRIIESMEKFTYKTNSSIPDKDSGYDHMSDAVRYLVDSTFPIQLPRKELAIRMWGHKLQSDNSLNYFTHRQVVPR